MYSLVLMPITSMVNTNIMRRHLILIIISFLFTGLYAQNGYILRDIASPINENIIDNGPIQNSKFCVVRRYDTSFVYTPNDIRGYGFKNSKEYLSREIMINESSQKVFLEVMENSKNNISLYFYRDKSGSRYFIAKDSSSFLEIYKNEKGSKLNFNDTLSKLLNNCNMTTQEHKHVLFKKNSLTRFVNQYNECKYKSFPRFRYGAYMAYNIYKYHFKELDHFSENIELTNFGGFSYHLFIDKPIYAGDFSFHLELSYAKKSYSSNMRYDNLEYDFLSNVSTIGVPILFRYTPPSTNKIQPYINMGGIINFNFKIDNMISEYKYDEKDVYIILSEFDYINKRQVGYAIGGGIEYKIGNKYALQAELRYNKLLGLGSYELGLRYFSFNLGIIL